MSSIITVVYYENKFNKNVMVCKSLVESSIIVFIINYNVLHDSIFSAAYQQLLTDIWYFLLIKLVKTYQN